MNRGKGLDDVDRRLVGMLGRDGRARLVGQAGDATHLAMIDVADAAALDSVLSQIRAAVHARTHTMMVLRSHFERPAPSAK